MSGVGIQHEVTMATTLGVMMNQGTKSLPSIDGETIGGGPKTVFTPLKSGSEMAEDAEYRSPDSVIIMHTETVQELIAAEREARVKINARKKGTHTPGDGEWAAASMHPSQTSHAARTATVAWWRWVCDVPMSTQPAARSGSHLVCVRSVWSHPWLHRTEREQMKVRAVEEAKAEIAAYREEREHRLQAIRQQVRTPPYFGPRLALRRP